MLDPTGVRDDLQHRLRELRERSARIEAHQQERDREVPQDWDDLAQYRENDEVVDRLDDMTRDEIARIEAALKRIETGTWGACVRCEEPIEAARLRAVPTAATCLACTHQLEAARGRP